jgi:hypothetical protein
MTCHVCVCTDGEDPINVWKFLTEEIYRNTDNQWLSPEVMQKLGLCDEVGRVETSMQVLHVMKRDALYATTVERKDNLI